MFPLIGECLLRACRCSTSWVGTGEEQNTVLELVPESKVDVETSEKSARGKGFLVIGTKGGLGVNVVDTIAL